jgi:purine-binding chemotaxis protein CheW
VPWLTEREQQIYSLTREKGEVVMGNPTEVLIEMEEDTLKGRYLTFTIGNESYGIEVRYITELVGMQAITEIPELPVYIKGIINLRGTIIPVMDVRLRFRKEPKEYDDRTCVIVVDIGELSVGLIVDAVSEVITIPEQDIVDPPKLRQGFNNRYIKNIGKVGSDVKLLLDCEKMLTSDELESIIGKL